jgi:flagellar biosynthesis/type III secretory pathway protein FliH
MNDGEPANRGRRVTAALVAACLALVALAGLGGFLVGDTRAATPEEARSAEALARKQGETRAFRAAYADGKKRGRRDGLREGRRAGKREAQKDVERRAAQAAPPAPEEPNGGEAQSAGDCPPGEQSITRMV